MKGFNRFCRIISGRNVRVIGLIDIHRKKLRRTYHAEFEIYEKL